MQLLSLPRIISGYNDHPGVHSRDSKRTTAADKVRKAFLNLTAFSVTSPSISPGRLLTCKEALRHKEPQASLEEDTKRLKQGRKLTDDKGVAKLKLELFNNSHDLPSYDDPP